MITYSEVKENKNIRPKKNTPKAIKYYHQNLIKKIIKLKKNI